ncbi:hypothetical protein D3C86_1091460 [compost metagenome]
MRACLLQVQFVGLAAVEQALGDLVAALLDGGIVARDAQPGLGGAQRVVGFGHLGVQQHQHVFPIRFGREVGRVRGLDGAAETAPEVQLPADIETGAVLPEAAWPRIALRRPRRPGLIQRIGADDLGLGIAAAPGDAELRARFHDLQAGDPHAGVVGVGLGDQGVKNRVVEDAPPLAGVWLGARFAGLPQRRRGPLRGPCFALGLEIRPHLRATAEA